MALMTKHLLVGTLIFLVLLTDLYLTEGGVGICYGRDGDNLPSPQDTINMCKSRGITKIRIYGPDHDILEALKGSNIELSLSVDTNSLQPIGANLEAAKGWIRDVVVPYASTVNFRNIIVGNEVDPNGQLAGSILPAMQNVLTALQGFGLANSIKVTTAIGTSLIASPAYPPSTAVFKPESQGFIRPIIKFLQDNGSPLMANIYTFFPHENDPETIKLDYALFTSPGPVFTDPNGLQYQNVFDAMLDGLYAAIGKVSARNNAGGTNYMEVLHSEGGWPFNAALDASQQNACTFYSNMISHAKKGTPLRPQPFDTYLFSMFDEYHKNPEVEKHFGIFNNDLTSKCNNLNFN